jgi:hypothetical protein
MAKARSAVLHFKEEGDIGRKKLRDGLSAVVPVGRTLWAANDESLSLERLTLDLSSSTLRSSLLEDGQLVYGAHEQFPLHKYLRLPAPPSDEEFEADDVDEADIEGMDFSGGYLWLVGSHSLKRAKPDGGDTPKKGRAALAEVSSDNNRFLLARVPLVEEEGGVWAPRQKVKDGEGKRVAAALPGSGTSNALTQALADDPHLKGFFAVPGKDNGFDIEGLAVVGDRVFLGLRGPVLRGWAVVLEVRVRASKDDPSVLELRPVTKGGPLYFKHFLQLGGLGIRDLCAQGRDLLILAGPTMQLDGPVVLYRWLDFAGTDKETEKPPREEKVIFTGSEELETVRSIAHGEGCDHAEGIALLSSSGTQPTGEADCLMVVYDSASPERFPTENSVRTDIIDL